MFLYKLNKLHMLLKNTCKGRNYAHSYLSPISFCSIPTHSRRIAYILIKISNINRS